MRICIYSSAILFSLRGTDIAATRLLELIGSNLKLVVPRLIAQEVTRNLSTPEQAKQFYRLFQNHEFAQIIDEPVPSLYVQKYINLGLPAKADAFIGACAEWMNVDYLISENRHFLRELEASAFQVMDTDVFVAFWESRSKT
jgi:PIN domain